MNRKQFLILLGLVVVIGAAGLYVRKDNRDSWQSGGTAIGQKVLPNLAVNDVTQIAIKSGTGELNLARRDQLWRVAQRSDYPANFNQISELLLKLADLKVAQTEVIGPSQFSRFELLPPGGATVKVGTLVELKDQSGKVLGTLLLGKKHMQKPPANSQFGGMGGEGWPDGRYVMTSTNGQLLLLVSDPLESLQASPEQWLNRDFLNIQKPRSIAVRFAEATNSWQLTRASETNDWELAAAQANEKLDATKIYSATSPFSTASFNDVAPLKPDSLPNVTALTVETFDGFTYQVKVGQKQNETYPVTFAVAANLPAERPVAQDEKAEDKAKLDLEFKTHHTQLTEKLAKEKAFESWIYFLPASSIDEMLKPRGQLLVAEKVETSAPAEP